MASVAIGGCMMPLEVFSPVMRRVAHVTPQAWGNDAFARLVRHGASVAGILPQLGVLAAVAAVLLALAAWRLRCILLAQPGVPRSGPEGPSGPVIMGGSAISPGSFGPDPVASSGPSCRVTRGAGCVAQTADRVTRRMS